MLAIGARPVRRSPGGSVAILLPIAVLSLWSPTASADSIGQNVPLSAAIGMLSPNLHLAPEVDGTKRISWTAPTKEGALEVLLQTQHLAISGTLIVPASAANPSVAVAGTAVTAASTFPAATAVAQPATQASAALPVAGSTVSASTVLPAGAAGSAPVGQTPAPVTAGPHPFQNEALDCTPTRQSSEVFEIKAPTTLKALTRAWSIEAGWQPPDWYTEDFQITHGAKFSGPFACAMHEVLALYETADPPIVHREFLGNKTVCVWSPRDTETDPCE